MSGKEINTANIKLAILLISTHGGIDHVGEKGDENMFKKHTEDINIRKINATTPGVCNLVNPDVLEAMGNTINKFINGVKKEWETSDILSKGVSNLELTFESPEMGQCELFQLTRTLRDFIPQIDEVHLEAKETEAIKKDAKASKKKVEVEPELLNPDPDIDEKAYSENIDKAYQMDKWGKGELYLDKSYSIKHNERIEENKNPYDNTIQFLGVAGNPELDVIKKKIPYPFRSLVQPDEDEDEEEEEDEDVEKEYPTTNIQLSEVLEELVEKGYTDTIIIDLSCSSGYSDRENRALKRSDKFHYGGKKQKRTKKYKKSNGKTRKTRKSKKSKKSRRKTQKTRKK